MKLYTKNNGNLEVFDLTPKNDEIKKYKEAEMEKIPETQKVLKASCNEDYISQCTLHYNDTILASRLNYKEYSFFDLDGHFFKKYYHKLESYTHPTAHIYRLNILNTFYNGTYDNVRLIKVLDDIKKGNWKSDALKAVQYLLITQKDYQRTNEKKTMFTMDNIINIPESLYYLECILQGYYKELIGKNIDNQLGYFELSKEPTYSISLEELSLLEKNNIIKNAINDEQLTCSSEIIKKVKTIYK